MSLLAPKELGRTLSSPRASGLNVPGSAKGSGNTTPSNQGSRRSVVPPPAGLTVRAQSRTSIMSTAYIARPDGGSLVTSPKKKKDKNQPEDLDKAETQKIENEIKKETRVLTKNAESSITEKEDELERIMSAEAQLGFEQMGRYQLNKVHVTRVAMDPHLLSNTPDLDYLIDGDPDFKHESEHCLEMSLDPELLENSDGLETWSGSTAKYNEGMELPAWLSEIPGVRVGFGFPVEADRIGQDKHPCQDSAFAARCGEYTLVGVVNSHGKPRTSAALAQKMAELMPECFFQSPPLVREGDVAGACVNAFHKVHIMASEALDLKFVGAACTIALIDPTHVWVAHVGDCRAVLAVPDPQPNAEGFHFVPNALTHDHKLSVKAEFDRVREEGAETRKLVNDNVYRLFVQDAELPGLVLSRAIGDRIGHAIGVHHTPSVCMFERDTLPQQNGESFLVLGTGSIFTVMSERTAVNWISRHYSDPTEAAESLVQAARERWDDADCMAKAALKATLPESFASAVIFFGGGGTREALAQPLFRAGGQSTRDHAAFDQVISRERTDELRRVVQRVDPTHELP